MQNIPLTGGLRLSKDNYKKPKKTITDTMQNNAAIEEKLNNYIELESNELDNVPMGSHLRYITYNPTTKKEMFRMGGILRVRHPQYVVLAGKEGKTFSVQRYIMDKSKNKSYSTRFFRKLKKNEITQFTLEETISKSEEIFEKQNNVIDKQKKEIENLKKLLKKK
tara:strand:- start:35 stop:529 length:495 start_codon:yes stop_codon:yes gene_type:complete